MTDREIEYRCCNRIDIDDMVLCSVIVPFLGAECPVCGSQNNDGFWVRE